MLPLLIRVHHDWLLSAAILDMDFHMLTNAGDLGVNAFERFHGAYGHDTGDYRSLSHTNFNHIFNSGYAAGYYSYLG